MIKPLCPVAAALVSSLLLAACSDSADQTAVVATDAAISSAAVTTPASEGEWTQPRTAWGDPDLQGMWPVVHLISVPLQRPAQYGDRLHFNNDEMAKQLASVEARNTRYEEEDSTDRIGMGHWAEETDLPVQTSLIVDPPNGQLPELTEVGKQLTSAMGTSWGREVFDSPADFDGWDRCISRGLPASMFAFQYNNGIQVVQSPGYVVINMEMIHEVRIIPVGDKVPALDKAITQWLGASRGHWEGNTLVVETDNFNGKTSMTNFGTPGSPAVRATSTDFHLVERFERVDEDTINYSVTVTDPVTQTASWTAAFPWHRDDSYQFFEYACNEDNYAVRNFIETSRFTRAQEKSGI